MNRLFSLPYSTRSLKLHARMLGLGSVIAWIVLMGVPNIALGMTPTDTHSISWQLKLDQQATDLLLPLQRNTAHHDYPSQSQATSWFQHSEFQKAFPVLEHDAAMGSHRAQLEVGYMYQYGLGITQNFQKAALWYYIASDPTRDDAAALVRGKDAYFGLDGYSVNPAAAAEWFQMAAELSNDPY